MSKQEIHDWYWSMEEIYKHNYNHLHNVLSNTNKGFFDGSFLNKITKDLMTYLKLMNIYQDVIDFLDKLFPIEYNELNFEEYQSSIGSTNSKQIIV